MDFVIFGNSKSPDLSFTVEPQMGGTLSISSSSNYIMYGGGSGPEHMASIDWWYLVMNTYPFLTPSNIYPDWNKGRLRLQETLIPITATKGEQVILDAYLKSHPTNTPHSFRRRG